MFLWWQRKLRSQHLQAVQVLNARHLNPLPIQLHHIPLATITAGNSAGQTVAGKEKTPRAHPDRKKWAPGSILPEVKWMASLAMESLLTATLIDSSWSTAGRATKHLWFDWVADSQLSLFTFYLLQLDSQSAKADNTKKAFWRQTKILTKAGNSSKSCSCGTNIPEVLICTQWQHTQYPWQQILTTDPCYWECRCHLVRHNSITEQEYATHQTFVTLSENFTSKTS